MVAFPAPCEIADSDTNNLYAIASRARSFAKRDSIKKSLLTAIRRNSLTHSEIAKRTGFSRSKVTKMLNDPYSCGANLAHIDKLHNAVGVTLRATFPGHLAERHYVMKHVLDEMLKRRSDIDPQTPYAPLEELTPTDFAVHRIVYGKNFLFPSNTGWKGWLPNELNQYEMLITRFPSSSNCADAFLRLLPGYLIAAADWIAACPYILETGTDVAKRRGDRHSQIQAVTTLNDDATLIWAINRSLAIVENARAALGPKTQTPAIRLIDDLVLKAKRSLVLLQELIEAFNLACIDDLEAVCKYLKDFKHRRIDGNGLYVLLERVGLNPDDFCNYNFGELIRMSEVLNRQFVESVMLGVLCLLKPLHTWM